jgi:hypothetical protein
MERAPEDLRILGSRGWAQPTWTVCSMVEAAALAVSS